MENIKKGRVLRDTLFGRVRIGTAVLKSDVAAAAAAAASAAAAAGAGGVAAASLPSPSAAAQPQELVVVIKEYDKALVEKKCTREGHPVHEDAKSELKLHAGLCREPASQHIVKLYDLRADATHYYAVLEYCSRGEFFAFVSHPNFTRDHARHFFIQLMTGVDFMHQRGVAHRDLSLENILLDEQHTLKICDFGVACETKPNEMIKEEQGPVGKLKYMAPEVFARYAYDPTKADVWSCGVILFIMLVQVFPFDRPTLDDDRFVHACSERINHMLASWGKPLLDPVTNDLFTHVFCPVEFRYTARQILEHAYCSGGDSAAATQQQQAEAAKKEAAAAAGAGSFQHGASASSSSSQPGASQFAISSGAAAAAAAASAAQPAQPSAMETAQSYGSSVAPSSSSSAASPQHQQQQLSPAQIQQMQLQQQQWQQQQWQQQQLQLQQQQQAAAQQAALQQQQPGAQLAAQFAQQASLSPHHPQQQQQQWQHQPGS